MSIVFAVRDRNRIDYDTKKPPVFVPVQRKGSKYDLGGEVVELFRGKVMAEALDRTLIVIKEWERNNKFPRPLYQIENSQCTHWYSAAQIINCHRLMYGRWKGKKYLPTESLNEFFEDIKKVWTCRHVVVQPDGNIGLEEVQHG